MFFSNAQKRVFSTVETTRSWGLQRETMRSDDWTWKGVMKEGHRRTGEYRCVSGLVLIFCAEYSYLKIVFRESFIPVLL